MLFDTGRYSCFRRGLGRFVEGAERSLMSQARSAQDIFSARRDVTNIHARADVHAVAVAFAEP
jgi:hypothetical protein